MVSHSRTPSARGTLTHSPHHSLPQRSGAAPTAAGVRMTGGAGARGGWMTMVVLAGGLSPLLPPGSSTTQNGMTDLVAVENLAAALTDGSWDALVFVMSSRESTGHAAIDEVIAAQDAVDSAAASKLSLIAAPQLPGGRLVLAPTGLLTRDHDDVRRFADAAITGMVRAREAGARRPLLLVDDRAAKAVTANGDFARAIEVAALAAAGSLWQPLEAREARGEGCEPVECIGVAALDSSPSKATVLALAAAEQGRRLARDLAGTEPERMAPPRFAEYCVQAFTDSPVEVTVLEGEQLLKDYPLLSAVARASLSVERHHPRVVRLVYSGDGPITHSYFFAGKGVVYDTGGADIKAGGHMAGMSRDKGGAAAVAGFMLALAKLQPKGVLVVAELGIARNSVGVDCFVSDEIITSHAGVRVRIGNTDAEGRLVMADSLSHLRELAADAPNPQVFSVATLTGHAVRAVGLYSIAIDNRAARANGIAQRFSQQGDLWGDPFEISRLRRDDWDFIKPRSKADDVLSCNNAASSATSRGHQFPMAFLAIASGLDKHGHRDSKTPIGYTHLDIAGSAVVGGDWQHGAPTGAPVVALLATLLEGFGG